MTKLVFSVTNSAAGHIAVYDDSTGQVQHLAGSAGADSRHISYHHLLRHPGNPDIMVATGQVSGTGVSHADNRLRMFNLRTMSALPAEQQWYLGGRVNTDQLRMAFHPTGRYLYAATSVSGNTAAGATTAVANVLDGVTGERLTSTNVGASAVTTTPHNVVSVSPDGQFVAFGHVRNANAGFLSFRLFQVPPLGLPPGSGVGTRDWHTFITTNHVPQQTAYTSLFWTPDSRYLVLNGTMWMDRLNNWQFVSGPAASGALQRMGYSPHLAQWAPELGFRDSDQIINGQSDAFSWGDGEVDHDHYIAQYSLSQIRGGNASFQTRIITDSRRGSSIGDAYFRPVPYLVFNPSNPKRSFARYVSTNAAGNWRIWDATRPFTAHGIATTTFTYTGSTRDTAPLLIQEPPGTRLTRHDGSAWRQGEVKRHVDGKWAGARLQRFVNGSWVYT